MGMSREDVIWVYRIFLGREPENDDVITSQVNSGRSRLEMITQIIESEEFASKHIVR
jgi:hypothetical protein